jgi:hypothetical protein
MAITECNLHVGAPQSGRGFGGATMAKPQYYDYVRKVKENKGALRDFAKENQIATGKFISEDLLIRSNKEIMKNILPFLKIIIPSLSEHPAISEFSSYRRYGGGNLNTNLTEDEARDNFFREQ